VAAVKPAFRIRALELPPAQIRARLSTGHFDIAISLGELPLSGPWESHRCGIIEKAVFCAPATAAMLGPGPLAKSQLEGQAFVSPIDLTDGGFLPVEDDCPITVGHEAMTFALALAFAAHTNQLVYGPVIGALALLRTSALVKLEVTGWDSHDPLYLAYNAERITQGELRTLISTIESGIASIDA
jgi:DNA-binding transcriptional LysR family regulator